MRIPTSNDPDKVIAIHIATTGIDIHEDHEILKVAIINKDGDYLFNSFIKPEIHTEWNEAEKFNGITPEMVKDAPIISDVAMDLQNIFDNAEIIVGHNLKFSKDYLEKFIEYSFDNKKLVDIMDIHRADYPGYKHKLADVVQSFCPDKYDDFMKEANTLERTVTYLMESYNSLLREREEKAKKEKQTEETKEEIKKQDDLDREDHEIEEENEKQSHKDINKEQQLIYLQKQVEAMRATIIALTATVDNLQKMVTSKVEELTATTELTQQQIQNVAINCNDVSLQLRDIILQNNIEVPDISAR
jgi:DNA polymerase III epsilon subunit-like protein